MQRVVVCCSVLESLTLENFYFGQGVAAVASLLACELYNVAVRATGIVCVRARTCVCVCVLVGGRWMCVCVRMCAWGSYMCVCLVACMCVCMRVCVCVCVCCLAACMRAL